MNKRELEFYNRLDEVDRHMGPEGGVPPYHPPSTKAPSQRVRHADMPANSGQRSDALRDALVDLHDRGRIDLFSHMADYLASVDEGEVGFEHRDLHEMAHDWADKQYEDPEEP